MGGGEISLKKLIQNLEGETFQAIIFVPNEGEISRLFRQKGYQVLIAPMPTLKNPNFIKIALTALRWVWLIRKNKINIIHANGSRACFYSGLAGKILRIPVVWHVRETRTDVRWYERVLSALANVILCVSKSVAQIRFACFNGRVGQKIRVVHNGVNTKLFKSNKVGRAVQRKELGLDEADILFGLIGNLNPGKGQDYFLTAFAKTRDRMQLKNIKVLIIGRPMNSGYLEYLERLVSTFKLQDAVTIKPYTDAIHEVYPSLDVFALPSETEGFSRSIIEAMSCGLPVIGTNIEAIREAVPNRRFGVLVSYRDVKALADAILALATDSEMRERMGVLNRRRVLSEFDITVHVRKIESIYKNQLSSL